MLNEAILKLETEMEGDKSSEYIQYVGKYMVNYLNDNPDNAENMLKEDKTIKGSLKHMEGVAMKKKVNNVAVLTPDEGFKSVLDYYGIEEKELPKAGNTKQKRKVDISLDDLL